MTKKKQKTTHPINFAVNQVVWFRNPSTRGDHVDIKCKVLSDAGNSQLKLEYWENEGTDKATQRWITTSINNIYTKDEENEDGAELAGAAGTGKQFFNKNIQFANKNH